MGWKGGDNRKNGRMRSGRQKWAMEQGLIGLADCFSRMKHRLMGPFCHRVPLQTASWERKVWNSQSQVGAIASAPGEHCFSSYRVHSNPETMCSWQCCLCLAVFSIFLFALHRQMSNRGRGQRSYTSQGMHTTKEANACLTAEITNVIPVVPQRGCWPICSWHVPVAL